MATVTTTFASYDRSIPPSSIDALSKQNHGFFTANTNSVSPRIGHCLDGK